MSKHRPSVAGFFGAMMLITLAGCGGRGASLDEEPVPSGPVMLEVKNLNWQDLIVYVYRAGSEQRLGLVTSMNTRSFEIAENLYRATGRLQFLVKAIGSDEVKFTEPLQVEPGWIIVWTIEQRLKYSRVMIR